MKGMQKNPPPPCFDSLAGVDQGEGGAVIRTRRFDTAPLNQLENVQKVKGGEGRRGTHAGPSKPLLVDITKYGATSEIIEHFFEFLNEETGEVIHTGFHDGKFVQYFDNGNTDKDGKPKLEPYNQAAWLADLRKGTFKAMARSRKSLYKQVNKRKKVFRIQYCLRHRINQHAGVDVKLSESEKAAYFGNLQRCGSVWTCPVCADRISRVREDEILQAITAHSNAGHFCYMLVLTFSHQKHDRLDELLQKFRAALDKLKSSRAYKNLMRAISNLGTIRALELTYGLSNGYHPHTHDLLFPCREGELTAQEIASLEESIFPLWRKACDKVGLAAPDRRHGVKITRSLTGPEYLTKFGKARRWSPAKELTRTMQKVGSSDFEKDRFTPFDMLRFGCENPNSEMWEHLEEKYVEYAKATYGFRQVNWSNGLKAYFGINAKTDQEIVEQEGEGATLLFVVPPEIWHRILNNVGDARLAILEAAEKGGRPAIEAELKRQLEISRAH